MDRNFRKPARGEPDASPPSEAWLFAQALLGKPIPNPASAQAEARAKREQLEWLASFSTEHEAQLRRLQSAEAEARHQRELLQWLATFSTDHERKLRRLQAREAEAFDSQASWERFYEDYSASLAEWAEVDHPRNPKGTAGGGQWIAKGGGSGAGMNDSGGGKSAAFPSHDNGEISPTLMTAVDPPKHGTAGRAPASARTSQTNTEPWYSVKFAEVRGGWTKTQRDKIAASVDRIQARLPVLIAEAKRELGSLSPCTKKKLGPWLEGFKSILEVMRAKRSSLWIYHEKMGPQGALAWSRPPGGSWLRDDQIHLNDDGGQNWQTRKDKELDKLLFHELLHLASAKILDNDAPSDLYNAHSIQSMISVGIAGNAFYREAKKKAIEECQGGR